jgi:hypothetical protein
MLPFLRRQRFKLREGALQSYEIEAIQDHLAGFINREVINDKGTFYDKINMPAYSIE